MWAKQELWVILSKEGKQIWQILKANYQSSG